MFFQGGLHNILLYYIFESYHKKKDKDYNIRKEKILGEKKFYLMKKKFKFFVFRLYILK